MKKQLALTIVAAFAFASTALAGPFKTAIIVGTNETNDLTLQIPAGRAITITNFTDSSSTDLGSVFVTINGVIALALVAANPGQTSAQKDLTVDGPATITVNATLNHTAVLTYKLFAN